MTVTNSSGTVIAEQNFDAWGRRRNASTWAYTNVPTPPAYLYRGYTGHEHLDQYNLINMNGRLYDPIVGRMLSVDNYVQAGSGVQGFNRYSYALNNPLKYNDPDGEMPFLAILGINALITGITKGIQEKKRGGDFIEGFGRGFFIGLISAELGQIGGGTFIENLIFGSVEGGLVGGLDAALSGTSIRQGIKNGVLIGGAFAIGTSTLEATSNAFRGHGLRMDNGVIRNYSKKGQFQDAIDFVQNKYGLNGVTFNYDPAELNYGITPPVGLDLVNIGPLAFGSPDLLKATMVHEYGHALLDKVKTMGGAFSNWAYAPGAFPSPNAVLSADGPLGYAQEIFNAGRMKIGIKALKSENPLWFEWSNRLGDGGKWKYIIPNRYSSKTILKWY